MEGYTVFVTGPLGGLPELGGEFLFLLLGGQPAVGEHGLEHPGLPVQLEVGHDPGRDGGRCKRLDGIVHGPQPKPEFLAFLGVGRGLKLRNGLQVGAGNNICNKRCGQINLS